MQVDGLEKRLANLRPYQRGENGHTRKAVERARLESEIIAELGADLTASDRLELRHAVELLMRRPRDHVMRFAAQMPDRASLRRLGCALNSAKIISRRGAMRSRPPRSF